MKVYIEKITDYDKSKLQSFYSELFTREKLAEKLAGKSWVLLKPNLLGIHRPEEAVTTHPVVIESLIRILKDNQIKNICLGDSPGGTVRTEEVWQATGIKELAEREGIRLLNFGKEGIIKKEVDGFELMIDSQVLKAPAIINISKYKTHSLTMFTGAIKNLFGTIPGLRKSDYHRLYPDPGRLAALLTAIYKELKTRIVFNIMDGIWGMEGEGPSAGKPRNFGVMFASSSATALDYVAAGMMGYDSIKIPTVRLSMEADDILSADIIVDEKWQGFTFHKTKIGKASLYSVFINRIPKFMQRFFYKFYDYYPAFNDKCRLCRVCVESCPVNAITLEDNAGKPAIDYKICIKCMCCHEFCPYNAVYIKKTLLAKLLLR